MVTITLNFSECEHEGDLERYAEDVRTCPGTIIDADVNEEAETGRLVVQLPEGTDASDFLSKFKETDACCFSQYG